MSTPVMEPVARPELLANGDEALYEIVYGRYVDKPPMSAYPGRVASRAIVEMGVHAKKSQRGEAISEMLFVLDAIRDLKRRPDGAFVSSPGGFVSADGSFASAFRACPVTANRSRIQAPR